MTRLERRANPRKPLEGLLRAAQAKWPSGRPRPGSMATRKCKQAHSDNREYGS